MVSENVPGATLAAVPFLAPALMLVLLLSVCAGLLAGRLATHGGAGCRMTGPTPPRPRAAETVAEVNGLTLGPVAGGPPVLRDACLSLSAGQVLGVVGRSGSGKSSLAHGLLGHVRPGLEVRAPGRSGSSASIRSTGRAPAGFVAGRSPSSGRTRPPR